MGQTSSHKSHARNDFIKNANLNSANYMNNSGGNGSHFSPTIDFNPDQELIEDEEVNGPTIHSKNSYVINFYKISLIWTNLFRIEVPTVFRK